MKLIVITVLTMFLFVADFCKNKDLFDSMDECDREMLERFDMIPTTKTDLGCKLALCAYELDGALYYGINSPCADIVVNPVRCDGRHFSTKITSEEQAYFFSHARMLRTIGIER
jgi:hypothetical protein